jgi:undecaprenyl pyrophosphate synthase
VELKKKYLKRFGMNKKEKSLKHLAIIMDGNGRWAINKELTKYFWTCSRRALTF